MKLLIVRHGETIANTRGIIQGQTQGKLSKKGVLQSKKVSKMLKNSSIDLIFSSDLKRAKQMADEIASNVKVPTYYTTELRARNSGKYEGKHWEYVVRKIGHKRAVEDINFKFGTYGESMADMQKRLRKFLKYISKTYKDQTVVLCTHRHCVAVLLSIISGVSLNTVMDQMKSVKNAQIVSNSEIVKFLIDDDNVTYFGDNKNILELMSLKTHPKI